MGWPCSDLRQDNKACKNAGTNYTLLAKALGKSPLQVNQQENTAPVSPPCYPPETSGTRLGTTSFCDVAFAFGYS